MSAKAFAKEIFSFDQVFSFPIYSRHNTPHRVLFILIGISNIELIPNTVK